jgi:cyclopropane-fatty-acyl-phospholipid synthase
MTPDALVGAATGAIERGWVPDPAVRWGIRWLCRQRLRHEATAAANRGRDALHAFIDGASHDAIAAAPGVANAQHYELAAYFFRLMLGPRLKYSCCWWDGRIESLAAAEEASLQLTAAHAQLEDGMRVLELGCGWGALSFWMAERFPRASIVAVSNSRRQRAFIENEARTRGIGNLAVITADMNAFDTARRFDRIVSVEMFEHMRNHRALLARLARWLARDGKLFVHVFCHRRFAYMFGTDGAHNWMGRHFFTGGVMPSAHLLPAVPSPFRVEERWDWSGVHYARTAEAWLANLDARRDEVLLELSREYGSADAIRWLHRWRVFLMACAELFGYAGGSEWGVAHYRFVLR